jgi:hypothetical protein
MLTPFMTVTYLIQVDDFTAETNRYAHQVISKYDKGGQIQPEMKCIFSLLYVDDWK